RNSTLWPRASSSRSSPRYVVAWVLIPDNVIERPNTTIFMRSCASWPSVLSLDGFDAAHVAFQRNASVRLALLSNVVMSRLLVEAREQHPRLRRDHRSRVVVSGEGAHGVERRECHDRHELDLGAHVATQKLDTEIAIDPAAPDADEDFLFQQLLISVGVCRRRPPVPDATDHERGVANVSPAGLGANVSSSVSPGARSRHAANSS